jgi:hypothetical protein
LSKEFGEATKEKVGIEQKQRDEAAERKRKGVEWAWYFLPFKLTMFQLVKGSSLDILRRISHLGSRLSLPKEERHWKKKCGKASHARRVPPGK